MRQMEIKLFFILKTIKYKPHHTFKKPIFSFVHNIVVLNKHFLKWPHVNKPSQTQGNQFIGKLS